MKWRLRVAREALYDIERHRAWLTQEGAGRRAYRTLVAIIAAIDDLPLAPLRWPASVEHPGYRTRIVQGYVIIYRLDPDVGVPADAGDVRVLRVFAPKQDRRTLL